MSTRLPISDDLREALAKQQEDRDAIQTGIDDVEAGRVIPYEQVSRNLRAHLREKFGLPLSDE